MSATADGLPPSVLAIVAGGLEFHYPAHRGTPIRRALDGVDLTVAEGRLFGVLGPNGSGKSTLFRLLATLARPRAGSLQMLGFDALRAPAKVRAAIGVVFQNPSLDPHLSVDENLRLHGRLLGLSSPALAAAADRELAARGLSERRRALVKTLSGGQARRVEIAKALLARPRLLLLDEPSTGLDPNARADLRQTLAALRRDGTTVLVTTHLMEEAEICDELLLLDRGRVVASGSPDALRSAVGGDVLLVRARDAAARRHLGERIEALLARDRGSAGGQKGDLDETLPLRPAAPPADDNLLLRLEHPTARALARHLLATAEERIESICVQRPTLEDVFLHLTGHGLVESRSAVPVAEVAR